VGGGAHGSAIVQDRGHGRIENMKLSNWLVLTFLSTVCLLALPGTVTAAQGDQGLANIEAWIAEAEALVEEGRMREAEEILDDVLASEALPTAVRRRALTARAMALLEDAAARLNDLPPAGRKPPEDAGRREELLATAVGDLREIVRAQREGEALAAQRTLVFTLADLDRYQEAVEELAAYMVANGGEIDPDLDRLRRCLVYIGSLPEGQPVSTNDDEIQEHLVQPERVSLRQPQYTEPARKARLEGLVITRLLLDTEGRVRCVKIVKGLPYGLNGQLREVAWDWRYEPVRLDGEPVASYHFTTTYFELQ
jgi:tetratricopeptide (TPR) repeat protein